MTEQMCRRAVFTAWVVAAAQILTMPVFAYRGHEYLVTGTISKIRGRHFEVASGGAQGAASDIQGGCARLRAAETGIESPHTQEEL